MGSEIRSLKARMKDLYTCGRCSGRGSLVEYVSYNGGVCFECNGVGHCLPRSKRDRAAYSKMEAELAVLEAKIVEQNAYAAAHSAELPDPDTLDLSNLLG